MTTVENRGSKAVVDRVDAAATNEDVDAAVVQVCALAERVVSRAAVEGHRAGETAHELVGARAAEDDLRVEDDVALDRARRRVAEGLRPSPDVMTPKGSTPAEMPREPTPVAAAAVVPE